MASQTTPFLITACHFPGLTTQVILGNDPFLLLSLVINLVSSTSVHRLLVRPIFQSLSVCRQALRGPPLIRDKGEPWEFLSSSHFLSLWASVLDSKQKLITCLLSFYHPLIVIPVTTVPLPLRRMEDSTKVCRLPRYGTSSVQGALDNEMEVSEGVP